MYVNFFFLLLTAFITLMYYFSYIPIKVFYSIFNQFRFCPLATASKRSEELHPTQQTGGDKQPHCNLLRTEQSHRRPQETSPAIKRQR